MRKKELDIVLTLSAKCYAIIAWSIGTIFQRGPNRKEMVCEWAERVDFYQAMQFAFIALGLEIVLFIALDYLAPRFIQPGLRLSKMIFFLWQSKKLRWMIVIHHAAAIGLSMASGGYHQGLWIAHAGLEKMMGRGKGPPMGSNGTWGAGGIGTMLNGSNWSNTSRVGGVYMCLVREFYGAWRELLMLWSRTSHFEILSSLTDP